MANKYSVERRISSTWYKPPEATDKSKEFCRGYITSAISNFSSHDMRIVDDSGKIVEEHPNKDRAWPGSNNLLAGSKITVNFMSKKPPLGSSLDDFLREDKLLDKATVAAHKRIKKYDKK